MLCMVFCPVRGAHPHERFDVRKRLSIRDRNDIEDAVVYIDIGFGIYMVHIPWAVPAVHDIAQVDVGHVVLLANRAEVHDLG